MSINRQHKDSVFSLLFGNPAALRELYGAITGVELSPNAPITINTLEDVLYKTLLNDISFEVAHKLVILLEHQSSINPNMAFRLLLYIARVYEKITSGKNMYGRKKLFIPRPEFIVLYNGTVSYPDEAELRLSDSFEDATSLGIPKENIPKLELVVKVYNINQGHNEGMARRCERLRGYSAFIAKVREYEALMGDMEAAMREAIRYCVEHDILKEFLRENGSEVMNMLLTEWKLEDALVVEWEEGLEEGLEKGLEKGHEEAARNLLDFGMSPEQISQALKLPLDRVRRYLN
jgi:predicted transposase/invertase (TIGR01784 family)